MNIRGCTLIALFTMLYLSTEILKASGPQYINDEQGVTRAMPTADREQMKVIQAHPSPLFEEVLASTALLRSRYQLEQADREIDTCIEGQQGQINAIGLICALFKAGNARLQGNFSDWARQALNIKHSYYAWLRDTTKNPDIALDDLEGVDLAKLSELPDVMVDPIETIHVIQYQPKLLSFSLAGITKGQSKLPARHTPYIPAKINGHEFSFLVDTGASYTVIDTSAAARLGIHPIKAFWTVTDSFGTTKAAELGIADSINIGGIELHHWPVLITKTPFSLLGLDALARLGAVRLDQSSLTIFGGQDPTPSCDEPMRLGSYLGGGNLLLAYLVKVDGELFPAFVDTGNFFTLIEGTKMLFDTVRVEGGVSQGSSKNKKIWTVLGVVTAKGYKKKITLTIDQKSKFTDVFINDKDLTNFPYILGMDVLAEHSLFMDFRKGTVCITDVGSSETDPLAPASH